MADSPRLNPNALTPGQLALLLSKGSANHWRVTEEEIHADIAAGVPTNPDGTIHLMTYCAWLIQERGHQGRSALTVGLASSLIPGSEIPRVE